MLKKIKKKLRKVKKKYAKAAMERKYSKDMVVKDFLADSGLWGDNDYLEALKNGHRLEQGPILGRDRRFWHMIEFFKAVQNLDGQTAEAGCLYGLSSYLICHYERRKVNGYDGSTHHMFDSFIGLSRPVDSDLAGKGGGNVHIQKNLSRPPGKRKGKIGFLDRTRTTLQDFPQINYYKGWIPELFNGIEKRDYKFVHIDLDLYEPIYHSLNYFYPQLVKGGCIVLDDHGFPDWPGAKLAADQWAQENGCNLIRLMTGNAAIFKQ